MMQTIKYDRAPAWYKDEFNQAPPNWKELTEKEFAQSNFFTYGPTHLEYRQIRSEDSFLSVHLYYFFGRNEGFGLAHDYWKGKVRYFRFAACEHDMAAVSREGLEKMKLKFPALKDVQGTWGNCCHNSVCTKCGVYEFVDSSD